MRLDIGQVISRSTRHNVSTDLDERTLHEIYLPAFKSAVVEGGSGAVMTAYNLINGVHCSEHDKMNNEILKGEWGFDGLLMSDWGSTYDAVAAANGGLDLEMPNGKFMNRDNLLPAVKDGKEAGQSPKDVEDKIGDDCAMFDLDIDTGETQREDDDQWTPLPDEHPWLNELLGAIDGDVLEHLGRLWYRGKGKEAPDTAPQPPELVEEWEPGGDVSWIEGYFGVRMDCYVVDDRRYSWENHDAHNTVQTSSEEGEARLQGTPPRDADALRAG